jgi:3-oxoacyl-[acyl-carrier protein] reductase
MAGLKSRPSKTTSSLQLAGIRLRIRYEERSETAVVGDQQDDLQHADEDRSGEAVGPEQGVVQVDVDDNGREEHEGQWDEAADEEQQPGNDHEDADESHPAVGSEHRHEGEGVAGGQRHWQKVQDVVQAEDEEDEAENDAAGGYNVLHWNLLTMQSAHADWIRERGPCYNMRMSVSHEDGGTAPKSQAGVELSLQGKVVLVTGGSRGIGAATVRLMARAGARVVFSYRSAERQAAELVAACGGEDVCHALKQELATVEDGQALIAAAAAVFGRLDCLVVNHGIWPPHDQPIATMTGKQWRETMGINLDSVFGLVQAGAAQILSQAHVSEARHGAPTSVAGTRGHMVLVASTAAQRGEAFHADYAASKGALLSLTKSLSSELGPQGILCNCVAPGWVRTEMSAGTLSDPIASKKALELIPLGRPAEPEEIAGPILFLCTPWAGFVSGEVFNVNGGAVLVG